MSSRTFAANGARSTVSIFMLSSTRTGAPAVDDVADRDAERDDERRGGGAQHAALVAGDAVGDAVDLDQVDGPWVAVTSAVTLVPVDDDPAAVELAEPLDLGDDDLLASRRRRR